MDNMRNGRYIDEKGYRTQQEAIELRDRLLVDWKKEASAGNFMAAGIIRRLIDAHDRICQDLNY
jgi:hypothetical protein